MRILKSEFKNSNIEEIIKSFGKQTIENEIQRFNFKINRKSLPELIFYDDNEIDANYYDFDIGNIRFQNCWIEPCSKTENEPIKYRSGSYYAYL